LEEMDEAAAGEKKPVERPDEVEKTDTGKEEKDII